MMEADTRAHALGLPDPATGQPAVCADVREFVAQLSRKAPRDEQAEQAFLESKLALIGSDPSLSAEDRERAILAIRHAMQQP